VTSFPNKNATSFKGSHGWWCGRGHNNIWRRDDHAPKLNKNNGGGYENKNKSSSSKKSENDYYRCDMKNYWSQTCNTPKNLVELYEASIKNKKKK
jgi:hypothetical protein